jgi:protein-L-isoaspartate O-methyltransferase
MNYAYIVFEKFACTFEFISKYYLQLYDELVEKEIEMAKITSNDNVLVIGCGSLPATSVLSAIKSKAKTVAIDCDSKAVENACTFIKNFDFENIMEIKYADGLSYPVNNYDVIYVLYGVKQQKEMLEYLARNVNGNTRIVFRTTEDSFKNLVGKDFLTKYFDIKKSLSSDSMYTADSYLLGKKK